MADKTCQAEWTSIPEMELKPASGNNEKYEWTSIPEGNLWVTTTPAAPNNKFFLLF